LAFLKGDRTVKDRLAWKVVAGVLALTMMLGLAVVPAFAADLRGGEDVTIGADEVVDDDLYVAGETVVVNGVIRGDLFAAGSDITVNGTVEGDVFAVGQFVTINGDAEDVRCAAGVVEFGGDSRVEEDALAAGFSIEADSGSTIGRDLLVGGYQAKLAGDLGRNVTGGLGALEISGKVGGDVTVEVGEEEAGFTGAPVMFSGRAVPMMAPGLHIKEGAQIEGKLTYTSRNRFDIPTGAEPKGGTVYQTPVPEVGDDEEVEIPTKEVAGAGAFAVLLAILNWIWAQVRRLLTLLLIGSILFWLVPAKMKEIAAILREKPWPSLGWGFVTSIGFWVAFITIFVITMIVGIFLAVITFGNLAAAVFVIGIVGDWALLVGFLILWFWVSKVVFCFVGGQWILERFRAEWTGPWIWPLLIGVVLFTIVRAIPCFGFVVEAILTFFGLGAMWLWASVRWGKSS
jgi:hypothetical protein